MAVNGIQLREGQVWWTRCGHVVDLYESGNSLCPWVGVDSFTKSRTFYRDNGRWHQNEQYETAKDLVKLIKETPMKEINKFNPQPGDKIICNNGEEFTCCTLEFLRDEITGQIQSSLPILGYQKTENYESWQDWNEDGTTRCNDFDYGIREVIPAESKEVVKEEEPRYSVEEIESAFSSLGWFDDSLSSLLLELKKIKDPQYKEYLRLKAIYE